MKLAALAALAACIALAVLAVYANPIRQGAQLVDMRGLALLLGVAQIAAGAVP